MSRDTPASTSRETPAERVTPDDLFRAGIRAGRAVSAEEFPGARTPS